VLRQPVVVVAATTMVKVLLDRHHFHPEFHAFFLETQYKTMHFIETLLLI
jgi:hypothetical protein